MKGTEDEDISHNKGQACFVTCGCIINMLGSMFVSSAADGLGITINLSQRLTSPWMMVSMISGGDCLKLTVFSISCCSNMLVHTGTGYRYSFGLEDITAKPRQAWKPATERG